jgi:YidC/Oxa1 family membrane protein insertase
MSKQTMPQTEGKKRLRDIMSEAASGKQADQSEMNAAVMGKMIKVLPVFMFFIMLTVPGALALYYGVSNLVAVAQQSYLLKQDEEEMEEIAEEKKPTGKKATLKARAKTATPATVTKVIAKDKKKGKK